MPRREVIALAGEYRRTQARIGAGVAARALAEWQRVSPLSLVTSARAWMTLLLDVLQGERERSRMVAVSYLRLVRALETGHTMPSLAGPSDMGPVTLGALREEWAQRAGTGHEPQADDADVVTVEGFDWPTPDEVGQEQAARTALAVMGPAKVRRGIERNDSGPEPGRGRLGDADFLREMRSVMQESGVSAAGAASREALRGGRDLVREASRRDRRAVGWTRVTDGSPCAFCAMLAARGAVYRTQASAFFQGRPGAEIPRDPDALLELEKYHNNCHCQVTPVYSRTEFLTPEARRYSREWHEVTRGLVGDEARRAWRRHIEAQRRAR